MTLYEYAESIYVKLQNGEIDTSLEKVSFDILQANTFEEMVSDDDKCIALIKSILTFNRKISNENRNRASHIFITWLLGIGLGQFLKIEDMTKFLVKTYYSRVWLLTAMLHDYGYICDEIKDKDLESSQITTPYNLLSDDYVDPNLVHLNNLRKSAEGKGYFSYSYAEIENYFKYSKWYHNKYNKPGNNEYADHGIVGGCIAFNYYCRAINKDKIGPSPIDTKIQKIACFTAASHNIFKSQNEETDQNYINFDLINLQSDSAIRVKKENPLLLLLSLVDTIECTKRFSAKENPKQYLIQKTTLKKVKIDFKGNTIILDFSDLDLYIQKERKSNSMKEQLVKHMTGIINLSSWSELTAEKVEEFKASITLAK